jgi:glutamate/tyrosine decarboxylase-like PLP-dependent enzyme
MSDPRERRAELEAALEMAVSEARGFLAELDRDPVQPPGSLGQVMEVGGQLPEEGSGAPAAIAGLARLGRESATRSAGPRFFHFVIGGTTPAALAADWLTSSFDQNAGVWPASPLASRLEVVCLEWLRDLFALPPEFGGVLVTGGTMANFVCLAVARDWCGQRRGERTSEEGLADAPQIPVFSSGYIHASAMKSLAMLGIGTGNVRRLTRDAAGRLDLRALDEGLAAMNGAPAIVVANAGEVNTGDFDPIDRMAELAERHGAWLHVDGAFGLFARLSPRSAELTIGVERAQSVASDGHKWLNVPHDCGFAFLREPQRLAWTFAEQAAYLGSSDDAHPSWGFLGPEGSRRARAFAIWATLRAYGRSGYRQLVERHLDLADHLAARVDAEPELERLAEAPLNIVCFRWHPRDVPEDQLDELNRRLGELLLGDGRVFAGTTLFEGKVAFRPAIVNWRTSTEDVDALVDVLLELSGRLRS